MLCVPKFREVEGDAKTHCIRVRGEEHAHSPSNLPLPIVNVVEPEPRFYAAVITRGGQEGAIRGAVERAGAPIHCNLSPWDWVDTKYDGEARSGTADAEAESVFGVVA